MHHTHVQYTNAQTHVHVDTYIVHTKSHTLAVSYWLLAWRSSHSVQTNVLLCRQQKKAPSHASPWDDSCILHTLYVVKGPATRAVLDYLLKLAVLLVMSVQCLSVAVSSSPHAQDIEDVAGFTRTQTPLCSHFRKQRNFPAELVTFV